MAANTDQMSEDDNALLNKIIMYDHVQENATEFAEDNALIDNIIKCGDISDDINGLYEDNVLILGDSILKEVAHIRNAQVRAYRGDTLEDLTYHMKHDFENENLLGGKRIIVIHAGTNDIYTLSVEEMIADLTTLVETIIEKSEMDHPFENQEI